jgi:DNA-binding MarR family transcriptional regulator/N-acetylglutamate synthase-like GNAT family acetyltransferase
VNFFSQAGKMALGSRVRMLSDKITADAVAIYAAYDTQLNPKWFPVFYILSKSGKHAVTSIAKDIRHSHASVSKIVKEMSKAGVVVEESDSKDRRRTFVALSKKGLNISRKIELQYADVLAAIDELSKGANHDLWAALEEWDGLLSEKSLLQRVLDNKQKRESAQVNIVPYAAKYQEAFASLNRDWITTYFKMEKKDFEALDNPKKYILDRNGFIFVAMLNNEPVGVCALVKKKKDCYELAKMAVARNMRGRKIGFLLGKTIIEKGRELKAKSIFLESNTILKPAIGLYRKLGFKETVGPATPYERCNIQMELYL